MAKLSYRIIVRINKEMRSRESKLEDLIKNISVTIWQNFELRKIQETTA